jgi:ribosomal protein S6--L-glutamate ligase
VKIGILALRHASTTMSPMMPEAVSLLREWGAQVDVIYPEERCVALSQVKVEHDLYVLKSETELTLSLAGALHAAGAAIVNPFPAASVLKDKIVSTRILAAAGVPVPETWVTGSPRQLATLLDQGPIVVKPYRGSKGRGVQVVWDPDELDQIAAEDGPVYAQHYHRPDGLDRKIYDIGGQLYGVLRRWPARSYEEKLGEPFTVDAELHAIARRCGEALGVELYGVDVVVSQGKPWVVDMQCFPGFKGVPQAALRVADYLYGAAERVLAGEPVAAPATREVA